LVHGHPASSDKIDNCAAWLMEKRIILHGHTLRPAGTPVPHDLQSSAQRIFLLSPANASGIRGKRLLSGRTQFDLALRLRTTGAPLGEIFSFMSALYFRGKLAYAQRFANPPAGLAGIFVITSSRGLLVPEAIVTLEELRAMSSARIDHNSREYRVPLERDARLLSESSGNDTQVVLLGSIATQKYVAPLLEIFGKRLVFPCDFIGRGDMSRGGLLLRCSRDSTQLKYVAVADARRRGPRPAK
jgi:hypothetical protein